MLELSYNLFQNLIKVNYYWSDSINFKVLQEEKNYLISLNSKHL